MLRLPAISAISMLCIAVLPAVAAPVPPGLIQCPDAAQILAAATVTKLRKGHPRESFSSKVAVATPTHAGSPLDPMGFRIGGPKMRKTACLAKRDRVKPGDTLGKIALRTLGSAAKWREIAAANPGLNAKSLRVGTVISIPCAPVQRHVAPTAVVVAKRKAAVAKVQAPAPAPLPAWTARSGEYLTTVVKHWARKAGYQVVVATTADWKLDVNFRDVGTFEEALKQIVAGFQDRGAPPYVQLFPNKVLKIGGGS